MCSNFIETLLEKKLKISNLEKTKEYNFFPKVLQYNDNTGTAPYADLFRVRLAREEGGGWREGGAAYSVSTAAMLQFTNK